MRGVLRLVVLGLLGMALLAPAGAGATTPVPAGCDVPHRTAGAIAEAASAGGGAGELPEPIPYAGSVGTAADAATVARVQAAVADMLGCVDAGDYVGFLSLMTDGFLGRYAGSLDATAAELEGGQVEPLEERVALRGVRDVTVLADGRVAALVLLEQGEQESPELSSVLTFVDTGGRLLIDDWQPVTLGDANAGDAWTVVSGPAYTGAIVAMADVPGFVRGLTGLDVQGAWTPTADQIADLEAALPAALETEAGGRATIRPMAAYTRQYAGYVAAGRAVLLVNGFCDPGGIDWTREAVVVMDGGACFFQATYDTAAGTFTGVAVNGEA